MAAEASFRYLFRPRADAAPGEALESRYSRAALGEGRVVLRREACNKPGGHRYEVFATAAAALAARGGERPAALFCYHEVIFGWQPQRFKFDIDLTGGALDAIPPEALAPFFRPDDAPPPLPAEIEELPRRARADAVVRAIVEALLDAVCAVYHNRDLTRPAIFFPEDVAVAESCGWLPDGREKFSYHGVLVPVGAPDVAEARALWARAAESLPPVLRAPLDLGANGSTQSFRLLGNTKNGRTLRPCSLWPGVPPRGDPADHLVAPGPELPVYPRVLSEPPVAPGGGLRAPRRAGGLEEVPDQHVEAVLAAVRAAGECDLTPHRFRGASCGAPGRGALLTFDRVVPSHCELCRATHHNDNTLMLSLEPGPPTAGLAAGGQSFLVVEHCRRGLATARLGGDLAPPTRVVAEVELSGAPGEPLTERAIVPADKFGAALNGALGADTPADVPAADKAAPAGAPTWRERRLMAMAATPDDFNPHSTATALFEEFPPDRREVYRADTMRPLPADATTLAVRAQMKMGKTRAVRAWLDGQFPLVGPAGGEPLEPAVIRMVSFRVTFTKALCAEFPGFTAYDEIDGALTAERCPRLICQVESLARVVPGRPVDCLVVDESLSVLGQFDSGLARRHQESWAVFEWLVRTARRVLFLDANLGPLEARALARMRPHDPARLIWNRFPRAADDEYAFTGDLGSWLERLDGSIAAGRRVVIPTNSLSDAKGLHALLLARHPARSFGLYTSETPPGLKREHFSNVHRFWAVDVLIYTPTVTAGVSFELVHFDELFGLFNDWSCGVEACRQMLGRVRDVGTRRHFVCIQAGVRALPDRPEAVRRAVRNSRAALFTDLREAGVRFEYDDAGEIRVHESTYFGLWVELKCLENASRNDYAGRFIEQVRESGAQIAYFATDDPERVKPLTRALAAAKGEVVAADAELIAAAPDISPERAADLETAITEAATGRGPDVPPADRAAVDRHRLRRHYAWEGDVDAGFVTRYSPRGPRRVYRNLCRISAAPTVFDALNEIQRAEREYHVALMGGGWAAGGGQAAGLVLAAAGDLDANEARDLGTRYVFLWHFTAVRVLQACGFRCVRDERRVHREMLATMLQIYETALLRVLEPLSGEFELRLPARATLRMRAAAADRYLHALLKPINALLGKMYGIRVERTGVGSEFYGLADTATGRLFSIEPDDGPGDGPDGAPDDAPDDGPDRPRVLSRLIRRPREPAIEALETLYYNNRLPALDAEYDD